MKMAQWAKRVIGSLARITLH